MRRYLMDVWERVQGWVSGTHRYIWWIRNTEPGASGMGRYVLVSPTKLTAAELRKEHDEMAGKFRSMGYAVVVAPAGIAEPFDPNPPPPPLPPTWGT